MFIHVDQVSFAYNLPFRNLADVRTGRDDHGFSLSALSLDIERGSLTGILGPNGCGKTTLLRLMAGVLRPQHGAITID
jgi:ABC-type cobalamin/Fe3+-siderophores transport system ATPase subunit